MNDDDQVIRPELRFQDVHDRGEGYSSARLKAIKQAMQKLHTLETMAVNIYKYEITSERNTLNIQLVAAMANEMTHLQDFQTKLYEYELRPRKTRFAFWLVGFALGTGSRLLGPRRILKTNIWAEKKAVLDYQRFLREVEWDEETRLFVAKDGADEEGHVERWTRLLGESASPSLAPADLPMPAITEDTAPPAVAPALLRLKLTLAGVEPPIWRRLLVPEDITLTRLHKIIHLVTGWENDHLHEFAIAGTHYGRPDSSGSLPVRSDAHIRLDALPLAQGTSFNYRYDSADHWEVTLKVEKILPADTDAHYPRVLGGARAFPPENSGGAPGYENFLEALSDPIDPEHEKYRSRVGEDFDPDWFDLEATNERLRLLK
jgi:demethoxyubiquinone hydroxylase (CLK1/Coq7/Cat5 family)